MSPKSTSELDKRIGANIEECRLAYGMTRQCLAEKIGVTHQQLQKYETGVNRISASRLVKICTIFDVPIGAMVEEVTLPVVSAGLRKRQSVMRLFDNIDDDLQDAVIKVLRCSQKDK